MLIRGRVPVVVGVAVTLVAGTSCSSDGSSGGSDGGVAGEDLSSRFAGFEAAPEPDGDLSKVVWPDFVTDAGPEVQRLYEFQITHGELMRYMPCFCGCGQNQGHRSNRDCFVQQVNADGSVELDPMAPGCGVCLDVTSQAMQMLEEGTTPRDIRAAVDQDYADHIDLSTPTPCPPA